MFGSDQLILQRLFIVLLLIFPRVEEYGLKSQMRRAIVSVPCNIAEGAARQTKKEFVQFLYIAAGSASEVDTQLEIAFRLGYVDRNRKGVIDGHLENISKMISGLIRSIRTKRSCSLLLTINDSLFTKRIYG